MTSLFQTSLSGYLPAPPEKRFLISNVFKRGHRIRLHVTSSGFPLYDRNPNTGNSQGMDAELCVAEQTVYHDAARPNHILLPIAARHSNG